MADFFFKTTKFHALLLSIPKSMRSIATLFLLIMIIGFWFIGIYRPLSHYYQLNLTKYTSFHSMQNIVTKTNEQNKKIEKLFNKKHMLLTKEKKVSTEEFTNKTITSLFNCAHKAQLTINRHTPLEPTETAWFLSFHNSNEFQGSFHSIINFLQNLAANDLGIIVNNMTITKQHDASLILDLNFTVNQIKESFNEKK